MSDDGTMIHSGEKAVLRFERRLAHPIDNVWNAITDPRQLDRWLGEVEADLQRGGRFAITWKNAHPETGERLTMDATITELDPPRLLEIEGEPHGVVRFELVEEANGTVLTFTSTLDLPEEYRDRALAGWHYHLDALATALDGGETELVDLPNEEFERVQARYAA
jgi:uncharacterized protein YndB with AHSA1/START domain